MITQRHDVENSKEVFLPANVGHDGILIEIKIVVHPPNTLEHTGII